MAVELPENLRVQVSTGFLGDIFEREGHRRRQQLLRLRKALVPDGEDYWSIQVPRDQAQVTSVSSVLTRFHSALVKAALESVPDLLEDVVEMMLQYGREYQYPAFTADRKNALHWLAIHRLHVHGFLADSSARRQVFIPDLSHGIRHFAFISSAKSLVEPFEYFDSNPRVLEQLSGDGLVGGMELVAVNLCDTIDFAYTQSRKVADALLQQSGGRLTSTLIDVTSGQDLLLGAVIRGFRGYRSLRVSDRTVPLIGSHRVLNAAALRHGHAWPLLSKFIPHWVWNRLELHAKDALLESAEMVSQSWISPIYPNIPSEHAMGQLLDMVDLAQLDIGVDHLIDKHQAELRKLGILDVVRLRHDGENYVERLHAGLWAWDWTWALSELNTALYDREVIRSISLGPQFRLQPLHKRLLSIFETEIIRRLRTLVSAGTWDPKGGRTHQASSLWKDAFKDEVTAHQKYVDWPDLDATLSVNGTWLTFADRAPSGSPVKLSDLLRSAFAAFVNEIPILSGFQLTLDPRDAQEHSQQLSRISASSDSARAMTLAIGRLVLEMRNFIEHGVEETTANGLVISNEDHWATTRQYDPPGTKNKGRKVPLIEWIAQVAEDRKWGNGMALPSTLPVAATALLIDEESLFRTMLLIILLLHGARSHLKI